MNRSNRRRNTPNSPNSPNTPQPTQGSINELAGKAGKAIGTSPEELKKAAQNGDIGKIMSKLTPQQSEQLSKLLSDEAAARKLLSSPQAQAIIKGLQKK